MSSDKLQAVHEALANVFNQSNLNATGTAASHAAFDHETLSKAFSEAHPKAANTEHSFARFDYEALTGIFSETPTDRPSPTSFDPEFSDLLSERSPLSSNTRPSRPGFDDQAFADLLNEPPSVSTNTRPPQPSFDHQALAEMLSELSADPISPQMSSPGYDTDPSSAPVLGQIDHEEPKANAFEVAPPTNAENARQSPRARSLFTKLHHLFSTKEEALLSDLEKEPLAPSHSGLPHTPEPMARAIPTTEVDKLPRPADALLADLLSVSFEQEHTPPNLVGQPAEAKPVPRVVAIAPLPYTASACPLQATSLPNEMSVPPAEIAPAAASADIESARSQLAKSPLAELPLMISIDPEFASFQTEPSSQTPTRPVEHTASAASTVEHSALTQVGSTQPQRLGSLLAEIASTISANSKPPLAISEEEPSRPTFSAQLENPEPAANPSVPLTNSESVAVQPRQPRLLQSEILATGSTSTRPQPCILTIPSSPTIELRQPKHAVPPAKLFAAAPLPDADAARPQQHKLLLADLPPSRSSFERKASPAIFAGEFDKVEPAVETVATTAQGHAVAVSVAVAHPIGEEGVHASSLLAALSVLNAKPSPPLLPSEPSLSNLASQPSDPVMPVETTAHPTDAESGLSLQTKLLHTEMPAVVSTDTTPSAPILEKEPPSHGSASYQPADAALTAKAVADTPPIDWESAVTRVEQAKSLLAEIDLNTAIHLRWVMRDIRSKRTKFSPVSADDLTMLMELGLVEMREEIPRLTGLGVLALD
jgi:hypothetical protein